MKSFFTAMGNNLLPKQNLKNPRTKLIERKWMISKLKLQNYLGITLAPDVTLCH
jgi:hypothetical protein